MQELIGGMAMSIPLAAKQAGHKHPFSSLVDYVRVKAMSDHVASEAAQFFIDLVALPTAEMIEKWYGNDSSVVSLITETVLEGEIDEHLKEYEKYVSTLVTFPLKRFSKPRSPKRKKSAAKKPKAGTLSPYCSECSPHGNSKYRAVRDGLCALHLSRRDAQR
jgi:hypothetical protein